MSFGIRSVLRIISSFFVNIAAGFVLLFPTLHNPVILTADILFCIVSVVIAIKFDEYLEEL